MHLVCVEEIVKFVEICWMIFTVSIQIFSTHIILMFSSSSLSVNRPYKPDVSLRHFLSTDVSKQRENFMSLEAYAENLNRGI